MLDLLTDLPVSPLASTVLAAAHVRVVRHGDGHLASVYYQPDQTPHARLDEALLGHPDLGTVLLQVMTATTGAYGSGLHVWATDRGIG